METVIEDVYLCLFDLIRRKNQWETLKNIQILPMLMYIWIIENIIKIKFGMAVNVDAGAKNIYILNPDKKHQLLFWWHN